MTLTAEKLAVYVTAKGITNEDPWATDFSNFFSEYLQKDHPFKAAKSDKITKYAGVIPRYEKDKEKLQYCCKKCAEANTLSVRKHWVKQSADYMGGTNDQELEMAIFTLSSHFIKDKAPKLFDMGYFVGFRILDTNDDNTKVVGIYGFKIGKSWVYIPVFFDKGKINGFELCYIQSKDQFVPLKEGWVDWIIKNSGDEAFGKEDQKGFRELGVRYPDMKQLTQPPILGKVASLEPWVQLGLLGMIKHAKAAPDMTQSAADLEKLASTDARIFTRLAVACDKYPILKVAMDAFYGKDFFQRTSDRLLNTYAKIARAKVAFSKKEIATKHAAVRVITQDDTSAFPFLTEKQAAELVDGPLAIDERADDEVAEIEDEIKFVSPNKTGVYDVFFADGSFRECLVVIDPLLMDKRNNQELSLVVDWKRGSHIYAKSPAILCVVGSYKDDWFDRLPADQFKSSTSMRNANGKHYNRVIVTEDGHGTCAFDLQGSNGVWRIASGYISGPRDRTYGPPSDHLEYVYSRKPVQWLICSPTLAGRKTVIRDDKLILPKTFKYIDLDREWIPGKDKPEKDYVDIPLGTENDIIQLLSKDRKKLRAAKTASKYVLDGVAFDKTAAFKTLVTEYNFRAKIANEILAAVELTGSNAISIPYRVPRYKTAELPIDPVYGQGGYLSQMPDNTMSPMFPDAPMGADSYSGLPIQMGLEESQQLGFEDQPVPPEFTQEIPPPDPMAMQQATDAAQTGQKNVFDVSVLAGLLNTNRRDEAISDYTKIFRTALDRICRLYFHYLSDRDQFIERYGEENIDKFEETLLDVMSSLGDLLLFILQKDDRPELSDILDGIGTE